MSTIVLISFGMFMRYVHPNKNKLVNLQELFLLANLTTMYAVSYQSNEKIFSTVTNVMISLAFIQSCIIVFCHFLIYTCHCNVLTTLKTVKEKVMKLHYRKREIDHNVELKFLRIPERTHNYTEYREGLKTDDFKMINLQQ